MRKLLTSFFVHRLAGFFISKEQRLCKGNWQIYDGYMQRGCGRQLGLTWNKDNEAASGCWAPVDQGLRPWGKQLLTVMATEGPWVLNLAHASPRTFWEVLEYAAPPLPILVSYTACRALCDTPRNVDDKQLQALFARGSLVGLSLYPAFLRCDTEGLATVLDVLRHVDHILEQGGKYCLFFGSNFDGGPSRTVGLEDAAQLRPFAQLLQRRYGEWRVKQWTWENAFRWYQDALR